MKWSFRHRKIELEKTGKSTYRNPMFPRKTWKIYFLQKLDFFTLLFILILLIVIYTLFYSPLFQIKNVEISGNENISTKTLEEKLIKWQTQQRRFLIFKQSNIFMFSKGWLQERMEAEYNLQNPDISKKLPHTLKIEINEQLPTLIWKTNERYYYLDQNGHITTEIDPENLMADLLEIQDESNESVKKEGEILNKEKMNFIQELSQKITDVPQVEPIKYSMPNNVSTQINVTTSEGWVIFFESSHNLDQQIHSLIEVLTKTIEDTQGLEYIDLTIETRKMETKVYYK